VRVDDPTKVPSGSLADIRLRRRVIGSFPTYAEAERAVDFLSDRKFPVERVSIVGRDLHWIEQVTGRMSYAQAALRGALSGAITGVLIGWLFFVFDWFSPIVARGWLIVDGLWFGALVGTIIGLIAHAALGGRRDFASVGAMVADTYDVLVDEEVAEDAVRLLSEMSDEARFSRTEAERPAPSSTDPVRP
jgi:uncharacterized membrane protein